VSGSLVARASAGGGIMQDLLRTFSHLRLFASQRCDPLVRDPRVGRANRAKECSISPVYPQDNPSLSPLYPQCIPSRDTGGDVTM